MLPPLEASAAERKSSRLERELHVLSFSWHCYDICTKLREMVNRDQVLLLHDSLLWNPQNQVCAESSQDLSICAKDGDDALDTILKRKGEAPKKKKDFLALDTNHRFPVNSSKARIRFFRLHHECHDLLPGAQRSATRSLFSR
jgi:hypothetical protein